MLSVRFRRNPRPPQQPPPPPPPQQNGCRWSTGTPCHPCDDWCRDLLKWSRHKLVQLRYVYRDFTGTLPKRSFLKSSDDYYDWLVMVLVFASEKMERREMRKQYSKLGQTLKRSRRRLLVGFFEHYINHRRECGKEPWSVVMMMVAYCRNVHPRLKDYVASELLKIAIQKKHCEIVRILLEMIEDIDRPFNDKQLSMEARIGNINNGLSSLRPLSAAVRSGDARIVQMVLDHGAKLDAYLNCWERPVLLIAMQKNVIEIIKMLLSYGADPHVKDQSKRGALHWLVRSGNQQIAKILVDLGVTPVTRDITNISALMEACKYNDQNLVRFFLDYCDLSENDLNDALHITVNSEMQPRHTIIRMLLLRGADPNGGDGPTRRGQTFERPLDRAITEDVPTITNQLILAGADVDCVLRYRRGFSVHIRRILIKNVVERLEAGESIGYNYECILNIHSDKMFENCWDERRRMSTSRIVPGTSFAVVMKQNQSAFNKSMIEYGIDEVVHKFELCVKLLFPIHSDELCDKFKYMKNKWDRQRKVEGVVSGILDGLLPIVVVRQIAEYIHPNDIEGLDPSLTRVDDLDDLIYPRARITPAQRRRGVVHWRRKSYT